MTNPFTGHEWEGWTVNERPNIGCWEASRRVNSVYRRSITIVVNGCGDVSLEIHQEPKPRWEDIDQTSLEAALRSANAIADGAGGWE